MVKDRRVVVTGKVAGESRQTAEQKLREAGAIVQSAVNKDTDVLVIGAAVGAKKMNAARELGVVIIPWEEAFGNSSGISAPEPRAPMPTVKQWAPMLCEAAEAVPAGDWIFEVKWDGIRGIATVKGGAVSIQSRSGKSDLTGRFPWIAEELSKLADCVLDGELMTESITYCVFDILEANGEDIAKRPFSERRGFLAGVVQEGEYISISPIFTDGEELLRQVREQGLEGIVCKRPDSRYMEGARNGNWLKIKVRPEQEFVVLGYTPGEGAREWAFGALILGYYDGDQLVYAGKVGTGFDDDTLRMLKAKMDPLVDGVENLAEGVLLPRNLDKGSVYLAEPGLVVQVAFQKWTEDGRLWHPAYVGLREDKSTKEVVREK